MQHHLIIYLQAVALGLGATVFMDLYAILIKRLFAIPSLDYRIVGRWLINLGKGKRLEGPIGQTLPIKNEAITGRVAHYGIGAIFGAAFILMVGPQWLAKPEVLSAISFGVATVAAPFLILQPALGAGIAARKTPKPNTARLRSLMAHTMFGLGLYITAVIFNQA